MLYLAEPEKSATMETDRALCAADGYMFLGMTWEAQGELDSIRPADRELNSVLRTRVRVLLQMKRWYEAARLAERGGVLHPDDSEFTVQRAFAFHQLHRSDDAIRVMREAPEWIRRTGILQYNLACYEARLGSASNARQCIRAAIEINAGIRRSAESDPDLLSL